jgi:PhzF family phenazine biosynthesis protein
MRVPLIHVDAFTDTRFSGNPAAVCLLEAPRDDAWLQAVGAEMNLPETAFVQPLDDDFGLRWFTPTLEVDLCGHATLAAAHVLWELGRLAPDAVARFWTKSGLLTATPRDSWIELDFPAEPAAVAEAPAALVAALGVAPTWAGRNRLDWLVELESAAAVRALAPDLAQLATVPARGVIVTAPSDDPRADFVSRFFAPRAGIPEDPVTGSAHCALGPYWAARLGRSDLTGRQLSARGGVVRVRPAGDRAILAGQAVTVVRGELADGEPAAHGARR